MKLVSVTTRGRVMFYDSPHSRLPQRTQGESSFGASADEPLNTGAITHLIEQAREGDTDARDAVLDQLQPFIVAIAARNNEVWLQRKQGVSDLVQQSFVRVIEQFESFRGASSAEFRGWLKKLVLNEIRQISRHHRRQMRDATREQPLVPGQAAGAEASKPERTPVERLIMREQFARVKQLLGELDSDTRQIMELHAFQNLTFSEIASRLNRNPEAVAKIWYRTLVRLQRRLHDGRDSAPAP